MFEDPKFWLLISFIIFLILMYKPFKSMMIGGLDTKIEEIKKNINSSLQSFNDSEKKLDEAQKQTSDLENKINELVMAEFSVAENCFTNTLTNQNFKETLFRLVPNPVSKEIRIVNDDYTGDIDFELYDLN